MSMARMIEHRHRLVVLALLLVAPACRVPPQPIESTPELDAAALTSQGLDLAQDRSREGLAESVQLFEHALELNPRFAPAWSGLADSLALQGLYSHEPPIESLARALPTARQALQLALGEGHTLDDQDLARTHASLGLALFLWSHDFSLAEESFLRSLELDRSNGQTHHWYAMLLHATGRHQEAVDRIHLATAADPESRLLQVKTATLLLGADRLDEARSQLAVCVERFPDFAMVHRELGNLALLEDDLEAAARHFEDAVERSENDVRSLSLLAQTRARLGDTESAEQTLAELVAREGFVAQTSLALIEIGLSRNDRAMDRLERAAREREPGLVYVNSRAGFRLLRQEPRFGTLIREIGLVSASE